jgi:2-iminobutanoate/2-iminopropanoate deaminase
MDLRKIHTNEAPEAIGPYSQAIVGNGMVFCSGQIALNPATSEMVGETAASQAKQALENLRAVLNAAGSGMDKVTQTTIYLVNIEDFAAVNEVYAHFFGDLKPARVTVGVKELPKKAKIEISAIALLKN